MLDCEGVAGDSNEEPDDIRSVLRVFSSIAICSGAGVGWHEMFRMICADLTDRKFASAAWKGSISSLKTASKDTDMRSLK
jgi:hypothetical protein